MKGTTCGHNTLILAHRRVGISVYKKQKPYLGNQLPQVSIESLYSGRFFFCRNCRGQVSNKTEILPVDNDDQQFHKNRHAGYWCQGNWVLNFSTLSTLCLFEGVLVFYCKYHIF